jgi:hypothetical protein
MTFLFACNAGIEDAVEVSEEVRVNAFMSGKVMQDGSFVTPTKINDSKAFQFDYTMADFPKKMHPNSEGITFISWLHNENLADPERDWTRVYKMAVERIRLVQNDPEIDNASKLLNYEMLGFPVIKHFLNKVKPTAAVAEASQFFLDLLLRNGTVGEMDLLAENLQKVSPYLNEKSNEEYTTLIKEECTRIFANAESTKFRVEKSKKALANFE